MDTREKKTKLKLFWFLLCMLFSLTVTSCYGPELDIIQKELSDIKKDIETIKAKIDNGKFIVSVVPTTGGFTIQFSDGISHNITSGANGQPGENGTSWLINNNDSCWHYRTANGTDVPTTWRAIPRDGAAGAAGQSAPAPKVSLEGFWIMYEWNKTKAAYDTITTTIPANMSPYLVWPLTPYYVNMFVPRLESSSVPPKIIHDSIALPLYGREELIISFKGYGYKRDKDIRMLDSLSFKYWQVIYNSTIAGWAGQQKITQDTLLTNWQSQVHPDSLVVVFAANNPSATSISLEDSQRDPNPWFTLSTPVRLTDELLTKTYYDTLYYARMNYTSYVQSGTKTGNIQYFLVNNSSDKERSIGSYPIHGITPTIPPVTVQTVGSKSRATTAQKVVADTRKYFALGRPVSTSSRSLTFNGNEYMFDYLVRDTAATSPSGLTINQKTFTFNIDTPSYVLVIEQLMKDGDIRIDTIIVSARDTVRDLKEHPLP